MLNWWHNFEPNSVLASFGYWQIHWYGLCFAGGILLAYWLTTKQPKLDHLKINLENIFWQLLFVGLMGARLADVFVFEWWYFQNHLSDIYKIWQGGLAWQGGIVASAIYLYWYCIKTKTSFLELADILVPGLALGQAIGRLGNYFNQELFGLPTNLPWGIKINSIHRPLAYSNYEYFHPTFLYEMLLLVGVSFILYKLNKKSLPGLSLSWYLILTGAVRFGLEFIRLDQQSMLFGIKVGFILALVIMAVGIIMLFFPSHLRLGKIKK